MNLTDSKIVATIKLTKDPRAFGVLVNRYQTLVRGLLMRLCRDHTLAEDLAQETFIKAFDNIQSFAERGSFKSWVCSIAYKEFLMSARKSKSYTRTIERYGLEENDTKISSSRSDAKLDLDRALTILGDDERSCVILNYGSGMSHREVAEVTGLALGTVKSHVKRGKEKLKRWFDEQGKTHEQ